MPILSASLAADMGAHTSVGAIEQRSLIMLQRIHNALVQYMETNKRDNLNVRTGWRQRLQDIFLAHHHRPNASAADSPANLWQHYAEKK